MRNEISTTSSSSFPPPHLPFSSSFLTEVGADDGQDSNAVVHIQQLPTSRVVELWHQVAEQSDAASSWTINHIRAVHGVIAIADRAPTQTRDHWPSERQQLHWGTEEIK